MAEENEVEEVVNVEEGDEHHHTDPKDWLFVLLLRVTQANGRPLPIGGFTSRAMTQMIHEIMGVIPREVVILTDQEVVFQIEDESSIIEVSKAVQGLFHWGGQSIIVDSVVATQDSITEIIKEQEVQREKQKELDWEHQWMREDQQECQYQMIEILEKVSEQVKKVEISIVDQCKHWMESIILLLWVRISQMSQAECSSKFAYIFWGRSQYT